MTKRLTTARAALRHMYAGNLAEFTQPYHPRREDPDICEDLTAMFEMLDPATLEALLRGIEALEVEAAA